VTSPGTIPLLFIYNEIFQNLCYLPSNWEISECFAPDKVVLDVGANIGLFSLFAASEGATVYAIEANPCNFYYLVHNIAQNGQMRILPYNFALASENGIRELYIPNQWSGSSLINMDCIEKRLAVLVRAKRLVDFLSEIGNPDIEFVKIDCEGCEFEVLLNCESQVLRKIKRIALELHVSPLLDSPQSIVSHLESAGFRVALQQAGEATRWYVWAIQ
jgi:FkbM family methyltransferase